MVQPRLDPHDQQGEPWRGSALVREAPPLPRLIHGRSSEAAVGVGLCDDLLDHRGEPGVLSGEFVAAEDLADVHDVVPDEMSYQMKGYLSFRKSVPIPNIFSL